MSLDRFQSFFQKREHSSKKLSYKIFILMVSHILPLLVHVHQPREFKGIYSVQIRLKVLLHGFYEITYSPFRYPFCLSARQCVLFPNKLNSTHFGNNTCINHSKSHFDIFLLPTTTMHAYIQL